MAANEPVIKVTEWNGLRNTIQGDRQPLASLVTADNVVLDDTKALLKRGGYTLASAQTGSSLFATRDERKLYLLATNGSIQSVSRNFTFTTVSEGFTAPAYWDENAPWVFVNAGRYGYIDASDTFHDLRLPIPAFTVSAEAGNLPVGRYQIAVVLERTSDKMQSAAIQRVLDDVTGVRVTVTTPDGYVALVYCSDVDGGETYLVGQGSDIAITEQYQIGTSPLSKEQQNCAALPFTASIIAWHQGRIYAADYQAQQDYTVIWISQPFSYQWFDLATDGISVPGKILGMASYQGGLLIATDKAIWDLTGDDLLMQRFPYAAIPGYPVAKGTDGRVWCWTQRGLISAPEWKEAQFDKFSPTPGTDCFVTELLYKGSRQIAAFTNGQGDEATHY